MSDFFHRVKSYHGPAELLPCTLSCGSSLSWKIPSAPSASPGMQIQTTSPHIKMPSYILQPFNHTPHHHTVSHTPPHHALSYTTTHSDTYHIQTHHHVQHTTPHHLQTSSSHSTTHSDTHHTSFRHFLAPHNHTHTSHTCPITLFSTRSVWTADA